MGKHRIKCFIRVRKGASIPNFHAYTAGYTFPAGVLQNGLRAVAGLVVSLPRVHADGLLGCEPSSSAA